MGLIKRNQIQEKGFIILEKPKTEVRRPSPATPPIVPTMEIPAAETEAQRIIRKAEEKAEEIRVSAKEEGLRQGKEEISAHIQEALDTLNQAIKERKKIVKDAEAEILRLALKVAEQIIKSEVSLHRDVSLNIVAEAIGRVSDREQIIVKANREDAEYLKRYKERLSGLLDGVKSFSIVEDTSIEAGGCVIETNLGFIDARISTKLKAIEEAFHKVSAQ